MLTSSMHTINKKYHPAILSFCILAISTLVAGCQATSERAGTGELNLSVSVADAAESYLSSSDGQAFAVSTYGSRWNSSSCPTVNCSYRTGSPERDVLDLCETKGNTCAIFAIYQKIIWNGPVTLPDMPEDRHILKIIRKQANRSYHSTGTATVDPVGTTGTLSINFRGNKCLGDFDITKQAWKLDCTGTKYSGKITRSEANRFWGRSNDGMELFISQSNWPHLRKKLQEREHFNIEKSSDEKQAILKWAHVWGDFEGHIIYEKPRPKGILKFKNRTTGTKCTGQLEVFYGTTGTWNLTCGDDTRAEGSVRFKNDFITGEGKSSSGAKVTFRTVEQ